MAKENLDSPKRTHRILGYHVGFFARDISWPSFASIHVTQISSLASDAY